MKSGSKKIFYRLFDIENAYFFPYQKRVTNTMKALKIVGDAYFAQKIRLT